MKKHKSIFATLVLLIAIVSCDKDTVIKEIETFDSSKSFEEQIMAIPNNEFKNTDLISAYSEVMKEVLSLSKNSDFRSIVLEKTQLANKSNEDYVMTIENMTKTLKSSSKYSKSSSKIETIVSKIKSLDDSEIPMVFYPRAETLEDAKVVNKNLMLQNAWMSLSLYLKELTTMIIQL